MFTVKLADECFTINNQYKYVQVLCKDYIIPQRSAELIEVSPEERAFENKDKGAWTESYLESLAVYRKICERLLEKDVLLFHCSALKLNGKAYLFTAPSGTGKSTHVRLWKQKFGERVTIINDDKPLLRVYDDRVIVYGTPYGGKENLQTNCSAPVAGIVILKQAPRNEVRTLTRREAFPMLLNQTYRRTDLGGTVKTMELVQKIAKLPLYELKCTISEQAVEAAYDALAERKKIK